METKVQFGAVNAPTPKWATWLFRAVLVVTTALTVWVSGTNLIGQAAKVEWMLIFKVADALVFGFSKLFGVVPADEPQK